MDIEHPSRRTVITLVSIAVLSVVLDLVFGAFRIRRTDGEDGRRVIESVPLPPPAEESDVSVEEAIADRRSRREYGERALERRKLGQLLWAAQGVTEQSTGFRAAPSAGALYPLELYVAVGTPRVEGLDPGVYRYRPKAHELTRLSTEDIQSELRQAAVDQAFVEAAAVDIVACAVDERTTGKYGERGRQRTSQWRPVTSARTSICRPRRWGSRPSRSVPSTTAGCETS
jgi:hypothetical protein